MCRFVKEPGKVFICRPNIWMTMRHKEVSAAIIEGCLIGLTCRFGACTARDHHVGPIVEVGDLIRRRKDISFRQMGKPAIELKIEIGVTVEVFVSNDFPIHIGAPDHFFGTVNNVHCQTQCTGTAEGPKLCQKCRPWILSTDGDALGLPLSSCRNGNFTRIPQRQWVDPAT